MLELGLEETWPWTLKLGAGGNFWRCRRFQPLLSLGPPVPAVASQPPRAGRAPLAWGPELPGQQHELNYPAPPLREKGCLKRTIVVGFEISGRGLDNPHALIMFVLCCYRRHVRFFVLEFQTSITKVTLRENCVQLRREKYLNRPHTCEATTIFCIALIAWLVIPPASMAAAMTSLPRGRSPLLLSLPPLSLLPLPLLSLRP